MNMKNALYSLYDIARHLNGYPFAVSHVTGVNYIVQGNKGPAILLGDTETGQPIGWVQKGMFPDPSEKTWLLIQDLRDAGPEVEMIAKDGWDTGRKTRSVRDGVMSDFELGGKVTRLSTDTAEVMDAVGYVEPQDGWQEGNIVVDERSPFGAAGSQGAEVDRGAGSEEPDQESGIL